MRCLLVIITFFALTISAHATFHLIQIEQVIGGVNGDTSAQAIQFRMRSSGENLVSQGRLVAFDAMGANPILVLDVAQNVPRGNTGSRVLIVSSNFVNTTTPVAAPDFVLSDLIPADYLAAGRLVWEDDFGTVYWSLSWGGTNYTGSNAGSTLNDNNGDFGPSFDGPLPSSDTNALAFIGSASAQSTANAADYTLTTGGATFVNNAGESFTLGEPPMPPPDVHDLAVIRLKAPKRINLTASRPSQTKRVVVQIQNRSPHAETLTNLTGLVTLEVESLGGVCTNFNAELTVGKPNVVPRVLKANGKLTVSFNVTFDCANDSLKGPGHEDYRYIAAVHHEAIDGNTDTDPSNDDCPRDPSGNDKGCGGKNPDRTLGADVLTDVTEK